MASNEIRIPVSAEIQADHKSLLAVQKALENTLALAGKDTTFATNLRKSLAEIEPLIEKFGRIVMEPEIDKNALRELEHIAKKVFGTFDKTVEQGRFLDVSKMLSDEDLARIQEYTKQVAALGRELEKVRQHGAGGAASEWLAKPEVTKGSDVAARAAKSSIYKPAVTLEQNVTSFTNAASAAAAKSADLAQRVVELTSAYETATKVTAQAQANLKMLEASVPAIQRRADTATFASAITRIKGTTSAAQNMQANTPIKEIGATLYQFGDAGYIQASYRNLATRFFQALGMGVEQATSLAASQIDRDIVPALQRHFGIDETNMRSYVVDNGPMLSQLREAGAIFGEILRNELTQARAAGMGSDVEGITDYAKKKQGELASARSAVKKARTAENEAFEEWAGAEEAQKQAQDLNIELTSLATALREAAAAAKTLKEAQLKADQDAAKRGAADAEDKERERVMAPVKTHAPQAQKDEGAGDENRDKMGDLLRQGENAKAEANAFKASMQNAIKQWFSVQQIINIVKQGIRQAYQDIQGLDKAMTNIAVVTDMSVSDLWGKINEYMSIAQQYGVTTQGVYEVSQLYYQQGLSTNEVMAATTETLKLARIAGMGYTEAADAMTVAIRSFKMEMSDAATVTDVYSKVAAITASDSEELAIAMSKTASSAESVGSSFENTTAMLAVMIETTRESAQNLGSALKSIISRYGEMKVGLTVDSEGEDIDYNKVDTALKSVGISIKDAQGQFRDFDDVIFELSAKWDSLDKNTQRYIATIMAGNRQQSRFIALVDNWERLDEVAGAAHNAEDAGLLQYAKTLDSLETKINNIKTSFQQFYMNIINGPAVGAALDFINKLIQGLNKLGSLNSILNLASIVLGLKAGLTAIGNLFSNSFSGIITQWRNTQRNWLNLAIKSGRERGYAEGRAEREGYEAGISGASMPTSGSSLPKGYTPSPYGKNRTQRRTEYQNMSFMERRQLGMQNKKVSWGKNSWNGSAWGQGISIGGQIIGGIASAVGTALTANTKEGKYLWQGAAVSALGNATQGASMGAALGPWGAAIGGLIGALSGLPAIIKSLDKNVQMQHDYEKAKEKAEKANIERAKKTDEYNTLKQAIESYDELKANRNNSEEDYQAWISLNNQLIEKYPELISYMDEQGNAIADVNKATGYLEQSMKDAAKASRDYYNAKKREYELQIDLNKDYQYRDSLNANTDLVGAVTRSHTLDIYERAGLITSQEANSHYGANRYNTIKNEYITITGSSATITPEQLANFVSVKGWDWNTILELAKYWEANGESELFSDAHITQYGEDLLYFIKILADNDMMADKMFTKEDGQIVGLNSHLANYITGSYGLKELEGTKTTAASSNLYWLSQMSEADDAFVGYMEGATGIIQAYIEKLGYSEETIASWKDSAEYDELLQDLLSSWHSFHYRIQDEISKISENLDDYTLVGLQLEFQKLLGDGYASNPVYQAMEAFWLESNYNRATRYGNALVTTEEDNFEDYKTWSDSQTGPFQSEVDKKKAYYEAAIAYYREKLGNGIANFISTQSDQIIENYIQILEDQKSFTRQGGHLATIASARQAEFNRIFGNINEQGQYVVKDAQGAIIKTLSIADTTKFMSLLTADNFGTSEWAAALSDFEEEIGIELGNFEELVYENIITQVETARNKLKTINEKMTNYAKSQKEGFKIDDAISLFELLREENSDLDWEDVFEYNEEGLLVLKDFNGAMETLFAHEFAKANKLQGEITTTVGKLESDTRAMFTNGQFLMDDNETILARGDSPAAYISEVERILQDEYELTETQATAAAAMIESGAIKSREELIAFLEQQGLVLSATVDYYNRELEKIFGVYSLGDYISSQNYAPPTSQIASLNSLESWGNYALKNNLIRGNPIYQTDSEGNFVPDDTGNKIISSYEYNWEEYFNSLRGVSIDKYGELTIIDPAAYAQSLVAMLGETDQAIINDIYESVFEQYHVQWQKRQDELETFFADDEYTDEEVAKMFAWSVSQGMTLGDMSMEDFADAWGLEKVGDVWQATTEKAYYQILTYAMAQNPDLDFDDLPKWKEWATEKAKSARVKQEEAIKFLRDLTEETGPEALEKAISYKLVDVDKITEEQLAAFKRGELSVYDLIESQRGENGFDDPELEAAWKYGQEKSAIETAEWITNLIKKSILTPEELLEIWELLGSPGNFKDWATAEGSGFVLDEITGQYTVTAAAYDELAAAAVAKGATEIPSRLDFQRTLNKGQKEVQDAKTSAISALTSDATISDLDALYEAKLISEAEYLQAIAEVEIGNKTYYQAIIDLLLDETDKTGEAVNNVRAKEEIAIRTNFESLFGDNKLNDEMVQAMYAASGSNGSMEQWAADTLGITYKNGEWVIENVTLALQGMAAFFASKHGKEAFDQYLSEDKQQEFLAKWAHAQDLQKEAEIAFLEGISPESSEEILTEAVELGIATWEDIASYKQKGYSAFDTIRAIVNKEGGNAEWQSTLQKTYKEYQQKTLDTVEALFTDGVFSQKDLEGLWLASGADATFDQWIDDSNFFEKVGNDWVIKSREAYDEMVKWIADTYGPAFVAAIPSYEKLEAMGMLAEETQKEDQLDYLRGLAPDSMEIADLEKAVELGIISEGEMLAAVKSGADYWSVIEAAVGRMDDETKEAFAEARASYITSLMDEAEAWVETTTWTTEQLFEVYGGSDSWMTSGDYTLDLDTGEWKAITETGYQVLVDHVSTMYHGAYDALMPTYSELQAQYGFKNLVSEGDKVDIIKGLSYDVSLDDLEKLAEAGMITYQQAMEIWNSNNPWTALQDAIVLTSEEQLAAYNQMVVENNIAMGEAAQAFFDDSTLTWSEVTTLWTSQLGKANSENNIVRWAQTAGLEYIDGEWKITSEQAYNNMVAAAKELYGDAWAAMIPTKEDILAANLLEGQIARDSKISFIEGLDFDKITASDMQKAIEEGIITSEQLLWADTYNISYEELLRMAISMDAEMTQAFNENWAKAQLNKRESMETLFDDNILSQEEVFQMWKDLGGGQTFDSWLTGSGIEFIDGEFRMDSEAAFGTVKEWARRYWGDAWDSIPWSTITAEQWSAGLEKIERIESDAALESFFSDFDKDAGMDEAYKAVELGILTQEQLLHGLAQGFDVWDVVIAYARESEEDYSHFIDLIENKTKASNLDSAFSLGTADSWTSDQIIDLFYANNGDQEYADYIQWAQDEGLFFLNESGQWEAATREAYEAMLEYIGTTFGEEYAAALPTADDWEAANLIKNARTSTDRTDFIRGLTADANVEDVYEKALEYGIVEAYKDEAGNIRLPSMEELLADIGANLHTQEDVDAYNEAMIAINEDRVATVAGLMEDNSFTAEEIYDIYKHTRGSDDVTFDDWYSNGMFILQADGTYRMAAEGAYDVMVAYVTEAFGEAFVALLPTEEQWKASGILEDLQTQEDQINFLTNLDVNATIDSLNKAAELFGITFTEAQLNAIKEGSATVYSTILDTLAPEDNITGERVGPMAEIVGEIKKANEYSLITKLPFGQLLTTAEDYAEAYETLSTLMPEANIAEILEDGIIDLNDTIGILESSLAYESIAIYNENSEIMNAGEALLYAATVYGIALEDFFEMSVVSPAQTLKELGIQLSQLSAEQYDTYRNAQKTYIDGMANLISGTGTAENAQKMLALINSRLDTDEQWDYSVFLDTAEGIQLDRSKFFEALSILREQDNELYGAIRSTLVSSPELLGKDLDSVMKVQQAINELATEQIDLLDEQNAALREQASIYGEIYAQMSMNKSEGWDFLNAELHGNAENFITWGNSVKSTFEQLGSSDGIDPTAFINMLNYMQQMGASVETLGGNFASWGDLMLAAYDAFGEAILTGTNITVDDLGISTDDMTNAMLDSMKKTAKQQVEFLDGQIAMLEGIKALSELEDLSIPSITATFADAIEKYNAANGADITLDDLHIVVNGKKFNLTEEGLREAQAEYNSMFSDSGISFEEALQASLGNNFNLLLEGKSISITPTGTMEVALPAEFAAVTNAIDKTNNYLSEIGTIVASIAGLLKDQDLSTKEGMASYLTEKGMPGADATEEQIENWFTGADSVTQAIYKNYLESQGIPFAYSLAARSAGDYGENTYTVGNGESAVTGQKVVIMPNGTTTYATGKVVDGELEHKALPEDYEGQVAAFRGLENLPEEVSKFIKGISYSGVERTVDDNGNVVWVNKQTRKSVEPAYGGNLEQAYQSALNFINGENGSTYAQALFWSIMGQPEKIPGYGKGIKNPSDITGGRTAPVNVTSLLSTANTTLGSIQANTAEATALLAVIASGKSLDTKEGKEAYFAALGYGQYNTIDDRIPAPMTADGTQGYNAFDELLWYNQSSAFTQQMYRAFLEPVEAGAWGTDATTTWEGIVASSLTPSALATNEQFDDIMSDWVAVVEGTEGKSLDAYRPQLKVERGTAEYERYNTGEYIIGDDGYVYNKNATGGRGGPVLAASGWDVNKLIADEDFLNWFAGSGYGYNYYKGLLPPPTSNTQDPVTPTYTAEDKAERAAWLEYADLDSVLKGESLWQAWGFATEDDFRAALGLGENDDYSAYKTEDSMGLETWNYQALADALAGNEAFETRFSTEQAVLVEEYPEKINEYRAMAADREFLSGYEQREDGWYTAGENGTKVVDEGILSKLAAIIDKDTDGDGNLENEFTALRDQLSAIAKVLGIQLAPETLIEFEDGAVVNDAILRSTKAVDDAMGKLAAMANSAETFMDEMIRLNLNPQLGNITLEGARELVAAGVITDDQLNSWVYGLAQAYNSGDPEVIAEATNIVNAAIQSAISSHEISTARADNAAEIEALQANNATLQETIDGLTAEKTNLEGQLSAATTEKATLELQLSTARENLASEQGQVESIMASLGAAQTLETIAQTNYNNAVQAEAAARERASDAEGRYEALQDAYDTAVAQFGESSPAVQAKAAELAAAEAELAAANAAVVAAEAATEQARMSLAAAQGTVSDLELVLSNAISERDAAQAEVDRLGTEIAERNATIARLQDSLGQTNSQITDLQGQITANNETIAALQEQNAALQEQLAEAQNNLQSVSEEKNNSVAYGRAEGMLEAGDYEGAIAAFKALEGYSDAVERAKEAQYNWVKELINNGQTIEALGQLIQLRMQGYELPNGETYINLMTQLAEQNPKNFKIFASLFVQEAAQMANEGQLTEAGRTFVLSILNDMQLILNGLEQSTPESTATDASEEPEVAQPSAEPEVEPEVVEPTIEEPSGRSEPDTLDESHAEDEEALDPEQLESILLNPSYSRGYADQLGDTLYDLLSDYNNAEGDIDKLQAANALQIFQSAYSTIGQYADDSGMFVGVESKEQANSLVNALNNLNLLPESIADYLDLEQFNADSFNRDIQPLMGEIYNDLFMAASVQYPDNPLSIFNTDFRSLAEGLPDAAAIMGQAAATIDSAATRIANTRLQVELVNGGGIAEATGNVSGLALAEGNASLERLNLGARLAGKTLVGELGPELAVYDGMYHLLGQNGAEFVDLPSDAIVFNHRQTAGIIRGQVGYRGTALAEGNVDDLEGAAFAEGHITGPARAGIDQTIGQLKSLRAMWQNILDMDASQLAQAGGGGGGGNSLKATTADLEEWYNLMRQIEQIEQEITNLEAKRANIYDGSDYLKNLRETQKLLEKQRLTQQRLYEYQRKQLQAQADFINQHEIWSKFLTVGEDGLLQYIKGNEQVGGKGAIEVLQKLNEMSGAEQEKFVKSLEYTAKDEEGKDLEGEKLVARFYEELQDQIDQYDELYDTVHTTEAELEDLTSQIEDINREVVENQKELETNIYDIVVDAWEKEIELLEEQAKLVEEANKAYTDGLKKALGAERDLYEENKSTEERESLQRQLALLRRSGGSAAEIADLEEQLDDALKDEYFKTQEKMIENIEDANERQVKKLEEQITLQKEALEYEKDNGIIWTKVYDVLRGSQESILAFMQGNSTEQFFSKSALEQEEMLLDWAKKIGIYSEDQQSKTAMAEAEKHWNSETMWSGEVLSGLQGNYESLSDEQKAYMAEYFKKSYSDARLDGSTEAEAQRIAEENIKTYLTEGGTGTGIEDMGDGSSGGDLTHWVFKFNGKDYNHYATEASAKKKISELKQTYINDEIKKLKPTTEDYRSGKYAGDLEAIEAFAWSLEQKALGTLKYGDHAKGYSTGGLVDYTGLAMVHGSKSKPESFLNAAQTAQIKEALQATHGKENLLEGLHSTIAELRSLIHNISTINNSTNYEVSIAPGAVVINVDELANSYDVEELSADIMNRMAAIASKATNRGVSRR